MSNWRKINPHGACDLMQGVWLENPDNSTESGDVVEVVSVYFLDAEVEGSEYFVGEVPYTSTFLTALEEIAFIETTMVRVFETRWRFEVSVARKEVDFVRAAHPRVVPSCRPKAVCSRDCTYL